MKGLINYIIRPCERATKLYQDWVFVDADDVEHQVLARERKADDTKAGEVCG